MPSLMTEDVSYIILIVLVFALGFALGRRDSHE